MILTRQDIEGILQIEDTSMGEVALDLIIKRVESSINEYTNRFPLVSSGTTETRTYEAKSSDYAGLFIDIDDYIGNNITITHNGVALIEAEEHVRPVPRPNGKRTLYIDNYTNGDIVSAGDTLQVVAEFGHLTSDQGKRELFATAITIAKSFVSDVKKLEGDVSSESVGRVSTSFTLNDLMKTEADVKRVLNKYSVAPRIVI